MEPSITNKALDREVPRGIREMGTGELRAVRDRWIAQKDERNLRFIMHVIAELNIRASIEAHILDAGWRAS